MTAFESCSIDVSATISRLLLKDNSRAICVSLSVCMICVGVVVCTPLQSGCL